MPYNKGMSTDALFQLITQIEAAVDARTDMVRHKDIRGEAEVTFSRHGWSVGVTVYHPRRPKQTMRATNYGYADTAEAAVADLLRTLEFYGQALAK